MDIHSAPIEIGAWLGCLMFFVALLNGLWKLSDRARGKNLSQPLEVIQAEQFVKQEECMSRHNESVRDISTLQSQLDSLRVERRQDFDHLNEKVNGVAREVSGLSRETQIQNQSLARIDAKLDRIVEKRLQGI